MGTRESTSAHTHTHTTVIYSPFIMSLDGFCFFTSSANQKQLLFYSDFCSRKAPTVFSHMHLFVFFYFNLSLVIVAVYHSEGHVLKMNSISAGGEWEPFRSRYWLVKIILCLATDVGKHDP